MIAGPAADWLRRNHDGLNQRVRLARHLGGRPDGSLLSAWLHRLLPALCVKQASDAVLQATFDLVLLLAAQSRLPAVATCDAQSRLLDALPDLAPTLNARPELLAAFSNAAGNLGGSGLAFATTLPALASTCPPERLLEAGAVLAWRLGEPRLRQRALAIASSLPPAAAATALALPEAQLAGALTQLNANAWRRPGHAAAVLAQIGDFTGFGGPFAVPPLLLSTSQGHSLHVQCGAVRHRIAADGFGWRCLPDADSAGTPARAKPLISGCSSWVLLQPGVLACTRPDSFRIRIVEPV